MRLAQRLGITEPQLTYLRWGALLHDIGKIGIPDSILFKPGPLTEEEWAIMRQHPIWGYEVLRHISFLEPALDIPLYHHERWNGSGYPYGLRGEDIPLPARIFAVVDVWDALTSHRPYRPAMTPQEARRIIAKGAGTLFDPRVVEAFLALLEEEGLAPSPACREHEQPGPQNQERHHGDENPIQGLTPQGGDHQQGHAEQPRQYKADHQPA